MMGNKNLGSSAIGGWNINNSINQMPYKSGVDVLSGT